MTHVLCDAGWSVEEQEGMELECCSEHGGVGVHSLYWLTVLQMLYTERKHG